MKTYHKIKYRERCRRRLTNRKTTRTRVDIFGLPLIFVPPYLAGLHTFDLVRGCVCRPCRAPIDLIILDLIRSSIEQSFHYEVDLGSKFSIQLANASPVLLNWEETSWDPRDEGATKGIRPAQNIAPINTIICCAVATISFLMVYQTATVLGTFLKERSTSRNVRK